MLQCHAKKKHPCRLSATQHAVIAPEMPSKASLQLYCEEFFTQYALNQNDNMRLGNLIITNNNKKKNYLIGTVVIHERRTRATKGIM